MNLNCTMKWIILSKVLGLVRDLYPVGQTGTGLAHISLSTWFIGIPVVTYQIEKGRGAEKEKEKESKKRKKKKNAGAKKKQRRMKRWRRIDRRGEKGGELQEME